MTCPRLRLMCDYVHIINFVLLLLLLLLLFTLQSAQCCSSGLFSERVMIQSPNVCLVGHLKPCNPAILTYDMTSKHLKLVYQKLYAKRTLPFANLVSFYDYTGTCGYH